MLDKSILPEYTHWPSDSNNDVPGAERGGIIN